VKCPTLLTPNVMANFLKIMRTHLTIGLIVLLFGCQTKPAGIEVNPELIEAFHLSDFLYPENPEFDFEEVVKYDIDLNNNDENDIVTLKRIKGWNDPGDFHQIELLLDNGKSIVETNFGGWVKFGNIYPINDELRKKNLIDSDLIIIAEIDTDKKIVLAFGWVYASEPGLLSIFEANGEKPQLLFNKNFEVHKIETYSISGIYQFDPHGDDNDKFETIELIKMK
jgi:hypothetical protein